MPDFSEQKIIAEHHRLLSRFFEPLNAAETIRRLGGFQDSFTSSLIEQVVSTADPDLALSAFERWLSTVEDRSNRRAMLLSNLGLMGRLCMILGASKALGDVLVQNPELVSLFADPVHLSAPVSSPDLEADMIKLLESSISYSHMLDRIRYYRQQTILKIAYNDIAGIWTPLEVWKALSELADAILNMICKIVWSSFSNEPVPVCLIAMGKLGSRELNYSSDVDLVFIAPDDSYDIEILSKYCEKCVRAISEKMGRGSLYRVDLRLRPHGQVGPIVLRLGSVIRYIKGYAEPWEIQSLTRSRVCAGDIGLGRIFMSNVLSEVYRGPRSEIFLEQILFSKRRTEDEIRAKGQERNDIKLGYGGIRDIEFLVQVSQLLVGHDLPEVHAMSVIEVLKLLSDKGYLNARDSQVLLDAYILLRQVEHRIQMRYDLQSHSLPEKDRDQIVLRRMMRMASYEELMSRLNEARSRVRGILSQTHSLPVTDQPQKALSKLLGYGVNTSEAGHALRLLELSSDSQALFNEVASHKETAERMRLIAERAPVIIPQISFDSRLLDVVFSDEVEHEKGVGVLPSEIILERLDEKSGNDWEATLAQGIRRESVMLALRHAYHGDLERSSEELTDLVDCVLVQSLNRVAGSEIDVIALGRLGGKELLFGSDWDAMLLASPATSHGHAERVAEEWLQRVRAIRLAAGWFPLDLRLRPEGQSGFIVRTHDSLLSYASTQMSAWERMAFTRARSIRNMQASLDIIREAYMSEPWDGIHESEMLSMRKRIQTERARPWESERDLKLSPGSYLDIEWIVGVLKLRNKLYTESANLTANVRELKEIGLLSPIEMENCIEAIRLFGTLRNALHLLGFDSDFILPENPKKLDQLAESIGYSNGNQVLLEVANSKKRVLEVWNRVWE